MRLISLLAILCALNLTVLPRAVQAAPPQPATVQVMVRLKGQPLAADPNLKARDRSTFYHFRLDPNLKASRLFADALNRYQDQEVAYIRGRGIALTVLRTFNVLFNGFSATVPANQLNHLRSLPDVAAVLPVRTYRPLLDKSVPLIQAPQAWADLGGSAKAGRGIMIADIDTGIDISNPCFSDQNMPAPPFPHRADNSENLKLTNNKVIVARAFGPDNTKQYSAADTAGHGTFTASIEACDYNTPTPFGTKVSGVAPDAYLLSYNVFPGNELNNDGSLTQINNGTTSDPQIIAAMQAALLDGADVANLSLGTSDSGDPSLDPDSQAVSLATKAGMTVVVSAGNAGPTSQSIGTPASSPEAIAVGAVTNSRGIYSSIQVLGGGVPSDLQRGTASMGSHPFTKLVGPAPMVYAGLGRMPRQGKSASSGSYDPQHPHANDFAGKDVTGKIAIIERGITFFESKINNAAKAGAVGVIIFDNHGETEQFSGDSKSATLPTMYVSQATGQALVAWLQSHPDATVTLDPTLTAASETPGVVSDFSSVGYGPGFSIKPDLVAPGQDIYAAAESEYPSGQVYSPTGFLSSQGTSFSAPHVTGAVALVLQKHPTWTPAVVKSALVDTANTNVYLNADKTKIASVMQAGSGLVDVAAAIESTASLNPASESFGEVNVGYGPVQQDATLTLNDAGNGTGTWQVAVHPLDTASGLSITTPGSVSLQSGNVAVPLHLSAAPSTPTGDYDGYIELTNNGQTIHAPYYVHVMSQPVKTGSVLLVDNTVSRAQPAPPLAPVPHLNVTKWYTDTLSKLGKTYTYWDEGKLGVPLLSDMKRASAVIYFTGANLNGFAPQLNNSEGLNPPLGPADYSVLASYLTGGGKLFITGMGATLSDPYWTAIYLGGYLSGLSMFDNQINDKNKKGDISPPRPSAKPATPKALPSDAGIFAGLKAIDLSTKGDGAHDDLASYNSLLDGLDLSDGLIGGVAGLTVLTGNCGTGCRAYGAPALQTSDVNLAIGGADGLSLAVTSSDEPSFTHKASFPGRVVFFGFGFEAINNNTGFATREQVLSRILQWFGDHPSATVTSTQLHAGRPVPLTASLRAASGVRPAQYTWQVGSTTLKPTTSPTTYRFPHAGTYKIRVKIADTLGHIALSAWKKVTVH